MRRFLEFLSGFVSRAGMEVVAVLATTVGPAVSGPFGGETDDGG